MNRSIVLIAAMLVSTPALAQWGSTPPASQPPHPTAAPAPSPPPSPPPLPAPSHRAMREDDGSTGFAFGVRAAWAFPFGDLNATDTLGNNIAGQLPIWLEAGWRFTRNIYAGIYGQYAFGFSNNCPISTDCSTHGYRLGIEAIYNFAPDGWLQPWAGLGFGYEWLYVTRAGQDSTYKGFELGHVQAGLDLAVSKQLSVGPFASVSLLGKYTSQSANGVSNDISATHEWVQVGLKATFKI